MSYIEFEREHIFSMGYETGFDAGCQEGIEYIKSLENQLRLAAHTQVRLQEKLYRAQRHIENLKEFTESCAYPPIDIVVKFPNKGE